MASLHHPMVRFGEYLLGRSKIALDFWIYLLAISLAKHHLRLSQQKDLLVPIVFGGTNMPLRVQNKVS